MHNIVDQTFWILYFLCVWIFDTKQSKEWSKPTNNQSFKKKKKIKNMLECKINKQTTMSHYIERINAWTYYNAYAWVSFFTHTAYVFFRVISFEDWVLESWFSILKVKLAKHEVMVSIIFITSLIMGFPSCPLGCLGFPLPFPCLLHFWRSAFFNAWSL